MLLVLSAEGRLPRRVKKKVGCEGRTDEVRLQIRVICPNQQSETGHVAVTQVDKTRPSKTKESFLVLGSAQHTNKREP